MKKILVVSGSGKETSKAVAEKLLYILTDMGMQEKAEVNIVDIKDFDEDIKKGDMIISTMLIDNEKYKMPIFSGLPFLTGIRLNEEIDKIVCAL